MADSKDIIDHWGDVIKAFSKKHILKYGRSLTEEEFLDALYIQVSDKEEIEWIGDVWEQMYSLEVVEEILKDFDFKTLELVVETPLEMIPTKFRFNRKVRVKSRGAIWVIHKYDKDLFPSNPHAHNLDSNIKLHLGNGDCYEKRKLVLKIGKKELLKIREDINRKCEIQLPELEV